MTPEHRELLKLFQREDNRLKEERFVCGFTRNDDVTLAFINEERAFTDGINITVDPAMDSIFTDIQSLQKTSRIVGLKHAVSDPWTGLFMTARAQEVHECLHIIFTEFPLPANSDVRSTNMIRLITLAMIDNIIEDAFIENAGVSEFPDIEVFLRWGRIAHLVAPKSAAGTLQQVFADAFDSKAEKPSEQEALEFILDYNAGILLYPMVRVKQPPDEYKEYIELTKPLFYEGSLCEEPQKRHLYACRIFDILEPLLPDETPEFSTLKTLLGGTDTHGKGGKSFTAHCSPGRKACISRRLFSDLNGQNIAFDESGEESAKIISVCASDLKEIIRLSKTVEKPSFVIINGDATGAAAMHKNIQIKETKPNPDASLKKSYQMIVQAYRRVINNYIRRFSRLIHTENEFIENKKLFGTGISSKSLIDVKKRYWYQKYREESTPDIAVMLMIDGSGSMRGQRRNAAVQALVILHEVLESHHIEHSIVEHRAIYEKPLVEHNILLDFQHSADKRYNIMRLSAYDGTREGLSLFWAERYLQNHSTASNKVLIVISDGYPEHWCDISAYSPPVSTKDTANAAFQIAHRGTKIIAIALGSDCYSGLKGIYPKTVECSDLEKLTGQLLKMIADELMRN